MTFQAVTNFGNSSSLCIGEVTDLDVNSVNDSDFVVDGHGLYLLKVNNKEPQAPAEILAKFTSQAAATELARFFNIYGALERT